MGDVTGLAIVAAARGWIGTPYCHQSAVRGSGADCLGLIRGVWREVIGEEPQAPPPYSRDWGEMGRDEVLWRGAARHLLPVPVAAMRIGDVLLFRMKPGAVAKHLGVLSCAGGDAAFVHAYSGYGVVESPLSAPWRRRIVAVFAFPGRGD